VPDPDNPNFIREVYLIQTPDDYTGGTVQVPTMATPNVVTVTGANFFGGFGAVNVLDHPVQVGDYLELNGGGLLYRIEQVGPTNNKLMLSRAVDITYPTTRYRIIRQPRRIVGETSLTLSGNVAIDLGNPPNTLSRNVPVRTAAVNNTVPPATESYYEIMFAPNGGVVGKGTVASDKIILWVRDSTRPNVTDNDPVLIGIQVRTGFIGTYQVDQTSGDYYSFARDPRAGGM
jgi:hypothetical protein